jgi:hypothetical protein
MLEKSGKLYLANDSGATTKPYPTSQHNHLVSINHHLFQDFLGGPGFAPLCTRFEKEVVRFRSEIPATYKDAMF